MLERIETRAAEIGAGLIVRRALPNRRRRTVGAWCFLDHAGPMEFGRGGGMGVGPHPHIGRS
jgi:redox-sensitive bicupin YhaK (pirin superfamily)